MSMKGYDTFYTEPGEYDAMYCNVCGADCSAKRNVSNPTGYMEAMARSEHLHDLFVCPHRDEEWHARALRLVKEIENTESETLRKILRQDLMNLLHEHGAGHQPWQQTL